MSYCTVGYLPKYRRYTVRLFTLLPNQKLSEWLLDSVFPPEKDLLWDVSYCEIIRFHIDGRDGHLITIDVRASSNQKAFSRAFGESIVAPFLHYSHRANRVDVYSGSLSGESTLLPAEDDVLKKAANMDRQKEKRRGDINQYVAEMRKNDSSFVLDDEGVRSLGARFDCYGGQFCFYPDNGERVQQPFPKHALNDAFRVLIKDFFMGELSANPDVSTLALSHIAGFDGKSVLIQIKNKTSTFYSPTFSDDINDDKEPNRILERCMQLGIDKHVNYSTYKLETVSELEIGLSNKCRLSVAAARAKGMGAYCALYARFLPTDRVH